MLKSRFFKIAALTAVVAGTFNIATAQAAALVKVDGSSTVFPITEAVAEEFQKANKGAIQVTVGVSGTGGGFKKFCRGEIDIADASRPILKKEMDACKAAGIKYFELPIAYDALTVVVNPKNDWAKTMTVAELKKMWEPAAKGVVTMWSDVKPGWPAAPMKLFGPGADSGTFDYFTEAINGKSKASRPDFTASEDDNVLVTGVSRDKYALAYFGYAYYVENQKKLNAVAIVNKEGKAVLPSKVAVEDGSYNPLARPIFIYVNAASMQKPEVKEFVEFYLTHGGKLAAEVKYIALPKVAYDMNKAHLAKGKLGTVFGGDEAVGLKVEDLLKREAKE